MFTIKDVDFQSDDYGVEPYLNNWPMLYILENGKKAYVGQTNSINKRMSQHKEADSKKIFTKAHFIMYFFRVASRVHTYMLVIKLLRSTWRNKYINTFTANDLKTFMTL